MVVALLLFGLLRIRRSSKPQPSGRAETETDLPIGAQWARIGDGNKSPVQAVMPFLVCQPAVNRRSGSPVQRASKHSCLTLGRSSLRDEQEGRVAKGRCWTYTSSRGGSTAAPASPTQSTSKSCSSHASKRARTTGDGAITPSARRGATAVPTPRWKACGQCPTQRHQGPLVRYPPCSAELRPFLRCGSGAVRPPMRGRPGSGC